MLVGANTNAYDLTSFKAVPILHLATGSVRTIQPGKEEGKKKEKKRNKVEFNGEPRLI